MDMFGGLKRTTSRFAIAAAGLLIGGAVYATPASADAYVGGGVGGNCCADLEERVAELEATTVRKGNKKVSVTLSGWVVQQLFIWDDGDETNVYVGDKFRTLSSHFKLTGTATISPGWTAGFAIHVETPSSGSGLEATQFQDNGLGFNPFILHSNMFIKSERWGTLTWGLQSQASDNLALLPDLSGTIIQSNAVQFEGTSMFLRPSGSNGDTGLSGLAWGSFLTCRSSGLPIGTDCNGLPLNSVRYDTPTFGGFSFSASWGEDDFWDVAARYANTWGNFKVSAAVGYNEVTDERYTAGAGGGLPPADGKFFQAGASVLHVPTGLFVYGLYSHDDNDGATIPGPFPVANPGFAGNNFDNFGNRLPEMETFFFKAGIKRTIWSYGATTFWGEYGEVHDGFGPGIGCGSFVNPVNGTFTGNAAVTGACGLGGGGLAVTDSEVQRYGAGVMQEIDAAAMQLYAQWQHLELDVDFVNFTTGNRVSQGFDDLEMFMVGGVIFF